MASRVRIGVSPQIGLQLVTRRARIQRRLVLDAAVLDEHERATVTRPVVDQCGDVAVSVRVVADTPERIVETLLHVDHHKRPVGIRIRTHALTVARQCASHLSQVDPRHQQP